MSNITMDDAVAAGDGTLHGAIDYWQEQAALKDLEIMRLREALEEIAFEVDHLYTSNKVTNILSTPTTYDDLMAWHEAQLGEPVGYTDYYQKTLSFNKTGYPLYAKKG